MKVLLLKNVPKVGKRDQVVEVAEGYANHALFPKKLAIPASSKAIEARDRRQQNEQVSKDIRHALLDTLLKDLAHKQLVMNVKANPQGNLFSKIHPSDIVKFLALQGVNIAEGSLVLPEIKKLGEYTIGVHDEGYQSSFTLTLTT